MMKALVAILLSLAAFAAGAQITNAPVLLGQRGNTLPTNCQVGQLFFKSNASAGSNVYGCTSTNTWTQQGTAGAAIISGTPTTGQCAVWASATTIEGVDCPGLVGTPTAGDIAYFTSSSSQSLLSAGAAGKFLRYQGVGSAPQVSTLVLPNAATSGGVLYASAADTVSSSTAGAANAFMTWGGAGTAPNAVALTGLVYGNGSSAPTTVDTSAKVQSATQTLTTPRIIYKQGLPMVSMSSGTATGSPTGTGAFTGLTALTLSAFPASAYCYMPAGANVDGASTAGWYYCTFSSTTAGTIFNNRYTPSSTPPTIPGSPTAPTTLTSWTGSTGTNVAVSFSVPANSMGLNGKVSFQEFYLQPTSNANSKSFSVDFGAFNSVTTTLGSVVSSALSVARHYVQNAGATNSQIGFGSSVSSSGTGSNFTPLKGTVDTTAAVTMTLSLTHGTATDNILLGPITVTVEANGN